MVGVPDSAAATDAPHAGLVLDRAGLAERAGVPAFVVDLVIGAGLLTPLDSGSDGERFGFDDVEMLVAARTLVGEGVAVEELAALAMRHATNVENLIEDAIDLLKRHVDREGRDKAALVASVNRLVPVATKLVVGHFEKTLWARAMARIGDDPARTAGAIVVKARRVDGRVDPLAVYAAAGADQQRSVWLRPDAGMGLAAIGVPSTPSSRSAAIASRLRQRPGRCSQPGSGVMRPLTRPRRCWWAGSRSRPQATARATPARPTATPSRTCIGVRAGMASGTAGWCCPSSR